MGERSTQPAEVVVRVAPAASESAARAEGGGAGVFGERPQVFEALVFTTLSFPDAGGVCDQPEDQPRELYGLPLASVEKVTVAWDNYVKYINTFVRGEKAAFKRLSRDEIFKEVSSGLAALLKGEVEPRGALRVWWSVATPRFSNLPWELLAYGTDGYAGGEVSFVRGLPPDAPVPKLPAGPKLRLAFIHEPTTTPPSLAEALRDIEGIELIDMTGHPLDALQEAIKQNYELVHLVTDGSASLAYEGYLYLRCPGPPDGTTLFGGRVNRWFYRATLGLFQKLSPRLPASWKEAWGESLKAKLNIATLSVTQLSAMQRGSHLAVLSLSPPNTDDASDARIDGMFLPGVFDSFVCIGSSALPMPNVVAQVGAGEAQSLGKFWRQFYAELGGSLEVEKSVRAGLSQGPPLAVALFLRQRYRQTFIRQKEQPAGSVALINAELQQSKDTLEQLQKLKGSGLGEIVSAFEQRVSARQQKLQEELNPWLEEQEDGEAGAAVAGEPEAKGAVSEQ